jgi:PAS domain S-box-containing protein
MASTTCLDNIASQRTENTALIELTRAELESEVVRLREALHRADPLGLQNPETGTWISDSCAGVEAQANNELPADLPESGNRETRERAVFNSSIDFAIVVTDRAGWITDWNPGATHVMGWRPEEICGQHAELFFTPEDQATGRVDVEMQMALREGRASDERWHMRKDGQQFWASGEMMPLYNEQHVHLGFVKILRDRTAEHLAGVAVKETQERYRLALKATNDAVWEWDLASGEIIWNDTIKNAYGHTVTGANGHRSWWVSHIHPEDRERIETSIRHVITGSGDAWSEEYRFQRSDGSYASVLDRAHVVRDTRGSAVRMIGAMLDLTPTRTVEAELRKSEERFRTILETIEAAFAIVQVKFDAEDQPVDYLFMEANPAFTQQAGVDLQGKWVTEFAPDLERFWFEAYGHVAKTGESANFENYAEAFNRWFDVRAVRVGDPADRQIAIFFSDVTERRNAEERLRISEAIAQENIERVQLALAAGAIIGTWHWDLPTDSVTVDENFADAFGLDPAIGRRGLSFEQLIASAHPEDRDGLRVASEQAIRQGGAYAHQYRVRRSDGNYYWIEANGRVEYSSDGVPLSFPGVVIDIQAKRAIEAERDRAIAALRQLTDTLEQRVTERTAALIQAEEQLRQSQKMEAVGQLTGGLAHDFNNLLAGISGALELMMIRLKQGRVKDMDKYVGIAQGAARRAAALTHRLLAFSRQQTLAPRPTSVNTLVDGMIELIQRTVGPGVRLKTVAAIDPWAASVDPGQLENALLNLCINARDAMPGGGHITIRTENRVLGRNDARLYELAEGEYLCLSVVDSGTGMPPEVVAKAFDPFFTTKPIGQGTGLGLSMIYGFARQSGGQARIDSQEGQGTTVSIFLPRDHGEVEAEDLSSVSRVFQEAAGETILIVDDEPSVRLLLTDVLTDLGYTPIEAADSSAGLKVLSSDVNIDLLITDVGLPGGMNGRQMAEAARQIRPDLKVLFITGYAEGNVIGGKDSLAPGMQVMIKPFAMEALASRVRELVDS